MYRHPSFLSSSFVKVDATYPGGGMELYVAVAAAAAAAATAAAAENHLAS